MIPEQIIRITADDGEININSIDPFIDNELVVHNDNQISVVRMSEPQRITIDGNDIITGNLYITADQNVEVIHVIDKGPKGDRGLKGDRGDPGLNGAGEPFYEIIQGELYESTASVSILNDFKVTGSAYVTQNLITYGKLSVNSTNPSSFFEVVSDAGTTDLVSIRSQSVDYFKINKQGVVVLGDFSYTPMPVLGGLYYDSNNFYVGI